MKRIARLTPLLALALVSYGCRDVTATGPSGPLATDERPQSRADRARPVRDRAGDAADEPAAHAAALAADGAADDEERADDSEPTLFRELEETFGRKGEVKDGVYRLVTPRSDLFVTVEERDVPTGAFIESDFRFWRCPCGKLLANGQFVVTDYEANDVIDELHLGKYHVASVAPLLLFEQPRLLVIRFQGEGRPKPMAAALKSALSYTGDARHSPLPADQSPPDE